MRKDKIRIVATSDMHGQLPEIPKCDLCILGGDLSPEGGAIEQSAWLDVHFRHWLDKIPADQVVAVAGNHDLVFAEAPQLVPQKLRMHYLQDSSITLFGLKIYGMPWQLPFWGAFNLAEQQAAPHYEKIPKDTDILITHGPPFGIRDEIRSTLLPVEEIRDAMHSAGSPSLRNKVFEIKPKLCVFGHIHERFGVERREEIVFANVSLLDDDMEAIHKPVVFTFDIKEGLVTLLNE